MTETTPLWTLIPTGVWSSQDRHSPLIRMKTQLTLRIFLPMALMLCDDGQDRVMLSHITHCLACLLVTRIVIHPQAQRRHHP